MVTMLDVAKICGVSKSTISRVINNKPDGVGKETRARVEMIIEEMGYMPNAVPKNTSMPKTKTIGVILPDITNPFFPKIFRGVENRANERGYTVILGNTDDCIIKEQNYISTIINKRIDGVLLASSVNDNVSFFQLLKRYSVPCVLVDRAMNAPANIPGVFIDNRFAMDQACQTLLKSGNRDIAFITGPTHLSTSGERLDGYKAALAGHGIALREELIRYGDFSFSSGFKAAKSLFDDKVGFTALMASNDIMAIGAMKAIKENGKKIPDDIEVIGFDNIDACEFCEPTLTTIDQPTYEIGRMAVELLFKLIDGEEIEKMSYRIQPELIIRNSIKQHNLEQGGLYKKDEELGTKVASSDLHCMFSSILRVLKANNCFI